MYLVRELLKSDASSRVVDYFELATEGPGWFVAAGHAEDMDQAYGMYEEEATRLQQEIASVMRRDAGWTWEVTDDALCKLMDVSVPMAVKMGLM